MAYEQRFCKVCKQTLKIDNFYKSNNTEKYTDGYLDTCKQCLTMHVDNWDPDTYIWIFQECDVPWVPEEWNKLLASYGQDRSKLTGTTIVGRYLSKMRLKKWKDYKWKDTEFIQQLAEDRIRSTMKNQGYGNDEIAQTIDSIRSHIPDGLTIEPPELKAEDLPQLPIPGREYVFAPPPPGEPQDDYFAEQAGGEIDIDLTDEDRTYLRLKWGKAYKPEEWVKLEQLYEEMMGSYDVQGAGHIDTLKLVCKTSLKANQLIDMGDIEGYQKMSKVYNELMKSGNFTAAQNKAKEGEFIDSIGELVEMCEKDGYIERFYVEQPNDKVDFTIKDMQRYTRTLIEEETSLPLMIEKALKDIAKEDEESAQNTEDTIVDDSNISIEELEKTLQDNDFSDFKEFLEEDSALDEYEEA